MPVEPTVTNFDVAIRVFTALALGGIIGMEREAAHQPAGLRTHIAVALGAALFGVVSVHGFDAYVQARADSNYQVDVTRVASQVVVAIGFLGGGTILKHAGSVSGLTTGASLWVTAAVGLAAGVGSLVAAATTTGALLLSLVGLRTPRERIRNRLGRRRGVVVVQMDREADPRELVQEVLSLDDVTVRDLSISRRDRNLIVEFDVVGPVGVQLASVLSPIAARPDVVEFDID
jgi:putative Mg2+ transporter-C (MgtC) family protein